MTTWALVPLKSPDTAKSRLAAVLAPAQRRALFFGLARRVIEALMATPGIVRVSVVTSSDEVDAFSRSLHAQVIRQRADAGTAQAFIAGARQLRGLKPRRLLMIAGDLPLISSAAIETLLATGDEAAVVIVPDRKRIGTNALLCAPPDAIAPCFGPDSFQRHLAAVERAGLSARVLECDALALDLDTPEDLEGVTQPWPAFEPPRIRSQQRGTVEAHSW